jgi:predicted Ser/Thr protein kinase
MDVISHLKARYERTREEELSLEDYLNECKRNPVAYATAAERMLKAIGEPQTIDTRNDQRLSVCSPTRSSRSTPLLPSFTAWKTPLSRW